MDIGKWIAAVSSWRPIKQNKIQFGDPKSSVTLIRKYHKIHKTYPIILQKGPLQKRLEAKK